MRDLPRRRELEAVVRAVAEELGSPARETILFENFGKHVYELGRVLDLAGSSIMDVGGGLGVNLLCLRRLLGPGPRLVLVDRFWEYTDRNRMGPAARGIESMERAGIEVHAVDFWPAPDFPGEAGSFDVVTLLDVIEHLPGHPVPLLRRCGELLRAGGTLLLGGPNAVALGRRVKLLRGVHPYMPYEAWTGDGYHGHFREYTPAEYADLLVRAGLRVRYRALVAEPSATRARSSYHNGRHGRLTPTAAALWMMWGMEAVLPGLRPSVYCAASPGA